MRYAAAPGVPERHGPPVITPVVTAASVIVVLASTVTVASLPTPASVAASIATVPPVIVAPSPIVIGIPSTAVGASAWPGPTGPSGSPWGDDPQPASTPATAR